MKKFFLITSILFFLSCDGQYKNHDIVGKWKEVKVTLADGSTGENITLDGKPYSPAWLIEFFENGKMIEYSTNTKGRYSINNSTLIVGNRKYKIIKLTNKQLIYLEDDSFLRYSLKTKEFDDKLLKERRELFN